jgi:isopentenyl diphosphate isomerase/L-lactate dehydrogenase-like FMN-dependent dehydrogenase
MAISSCNCPDGLSAMALAVGAKNVFVGRSLLYGLAVDGEAGATSMLRLIESELEHAMVLSGARSNFHLDRKLLRAD